MRKEDAHGFKCPPGYKFDRKLMACVPKKTRFKTVYAYPYFFGGTKSGDQSGQAQSGQNGNGNGNGNAQGGNGNGNGVMVMVEMLVGEMVEVTEDEVI